MNIAHRGISAEGGQTTYTNIPSYNHKVLLLKTCSRSPFFKNPIINTYPKPNDTIT